MSSSSTLNSPERAAPVEAAADRIAREDAAAGCPKCGNLDSWGTASWCPQCGYYPRLGTCLSPDPVAAARAGTAPDAAPPPASHLEALRRLPSWAYVLAGGVLGIFALSVAVRLVTPDDSLARSAWSVTQFLVGGAVFVGAHLYAFFKGNAKTDRLGFFDMIVHPIEVWRPSFQALPGTARRVWTGLWSLTAVVCAVTVIGGIRWSVLTDDWGFKERPSKNMLKKIKDQMLASAKSAEDGADNLEDAINDFAGSDEDAKKKADEKKKKADLEMLSAECVVVGYNIDKKTGEVRELVLATMIGDQVKYAGVVTGGIPPEVERDLRAKLPALEQPRPFVLCPRNATWVKPVVACRVSFKEWTTRKQMQEPVFKELLDEVK